MKIFVIDCMPIYNNNNRPINKALNFFNNLIIFTNINFQILNCTRTENMFIEKFSIYRSKHCLSLIVNSLRAEKLNGSDDA